MINTSFLAAEPLAVEVVDVVVVDFRTVTDELILLVFFRTILVQLGVYFGRVRALLSAVLRVLED